MFHDVGWFMGGAHFLWWLLLAACVAVALFALLRVAPPPRDRRQESPHEILRRRLASGACTPEEYERCKALLDRDRGGLSAGTAMKGNGP